MREMKYEVRNEEIEKVLKDLGRMLKDCIPEGWGFALHLFTYGEGTMMFISSADRTDYINLLREFIQHYEEN